MCIMPARRMLLIYFSLSAKSYTFDTFPGTSLLALAGVLTGDTSCKQITYRRAYGILLGAR
jgi:hypothetical protein